MEGALQHAAFASRVCIPPAADLDTAGEPPRYSRTCAIVCTKQELCPEELQTRLPFCKWGCRKLREPEHAVMQHKVVQSRTE